MPLSLKLHICAVFVEKYMYVVEKALTDYRQDAHRAIH